MEERELLQAWESFTARMTWSSVLERSQTDQSRQVAQRTLAELPDVTAVAALRANAQLVSLLIGRRWYVMRAAREEGATWDEIGEALGMSRQGAYDWYRRKIAEQEQLGDIHDATRAQAALDNS